MKRRSPSQLFVSCLCFTLLFSQATRAQETPKKLSDPELDSVQAMIRQAREESKHFKESGGKTTDPNHPNRKWAAALWKYRSEHPGTAATARATSEALNLLSLAGQIGEMQAKADTLKPDDPAWKQVFNVLMEAASNKGDYTYVINKTQALLQKPAEVLKEA